MPEPADVGVVAIGRNEGDRLRLCLLSLQDVQHRVYVDSGSSDGSQELARSLGFELVQLAIPPGFTAARARNEGLKRLLELAPHVALVQMVDGDVELAAGWIGTAATVMVERPDLAAVFGRLRERRPDASVYNMICDDEWNVPVGETRTCGGIAMMRVAAVTEAGGYTPSLIAGEEPDLCLRMRSADWKILRVNAEMGQHDAAMTRFSQWWRRTKRGGHAFAELRHRHGRNSNPHWAKEIHRILFWGLLALGALLLLIAGLLATSVALFATGIGLLLLFDLQIARVALRRRAEGWPLVKALTWAFFLMLGKLPQLQGVIQYHVTRLSGGQSKLIEYKASA